MPRGQLSITWKNCEILVRVLMLEIFPHTQSGHVVLCVAKIVSSSAEFFNFSIFEQFFLSNVRWVSSSNLYNNIIVIFYAICSKYRPVNFIYMYNFCLEWFISVLALFEYEVVFNNNEYNINLFVLILTRYLL